MAKASGDSLRRQLTLNKCMRTFCVIVVFLFCLCFLRPKPTPGAMIGRRLPADTGQYRGLCQNWCIVCQTQIFRQNGRIDMTQLASNSLEIALCATLPNCMTLKSEYIRKGLNYLLIYRLAFSVSNSIV